MIEEIKIAGILYKISESEKDDCSKCDLGQFCDRNMDFPMVCFNQNGGYIFKKQ